MDQIILNTNNNVQKNIWKWSSRGVKCVMLLMRVCNLSITCWISEIIHQLYSGKCLHTHVPCLTETSVIHCNKHDFTFLRLWNRRYHLFWLRSCCHVLLRCQVLSFCVLLFVCSQFYHGVSAPSATLAVLAS
jgi:hypothetical protein